MVITTLTVVFLEGGGGGRFALYSFEISFRKDGFFESKTAMHESGCFSFKSFMSVKAKPATA
jgi:hypothetical protein